MIIMNKLKITEIKDFKNILDILSNIVSIAHVDFSGREVTVEGSDPGNTAIVSIKIDQENIEELESDEDLRVALNVEKLDKVFKKLTDDDYVELEFDERTCEITSEGQIRKEFELPCLQHEDPPGYDLEFEFTQEVNANLFNEAINSASIMSDTISLEVNSEFLEITGTGNNSRSQYRLELDDNDLEIRSKYSLDKLKKISKIKKIEDTIDLSFGDSFPLKVSGENENDIKMSVYLAPHASQNR